MSNRNPRINVVVTEEQHSLLLQLSALQNRSAASYLREMLDNVTPLLRASVPALAAASEEMELKREQAAELLKEPFARLRELGMLGQPDFIDAQHDKKSAPGPHRSERSERGRSKRRTSSRD